MNDNLLGDFHQAQMDELKTIINKIDSLSVAQQGSPNLQGELDRIKSLVGNIKLPAQDNTELKRLLGTIAHSQADSSQVVEIDKLIRSCNNNLVDIYDSIGSRIDKIAEYQKHDPKPKTTIHKLDLSSWKNSIALCCCIIITIGTIFWAFNLHNENDKLRTNDLKYRYIKMQGYASTTLVIELEDYFHQDDNAAGIKSIRHKIEEYEATINKKVIAEEQARLRTQEAAELDRKIKKLQKK